MLQAARWMFAVATVLVGITFLHAQGGLGGLGVQGDEMVPNPFYKYWSNCKPGSTVTLLEKTVLSGPDKNQFPDGIDEKEVSCKLLSVTAEHVVVEFVVTEREFLDAIETAPTKKTYPAKVTKAKAAAPPSRLASR